MTEMLLTDHIHPRHIQGISLARRAKPHSRSLGLLLQGYSLHGIVTFIEMIQTAAVIIEEAAHTTVMTMAIVGMAITIV
jgi:hypothetical protein